MKNRSLVIVAVLLGIALVGLIVFALFFHTKSAPVSTLTANPFADAVETASANTVASPATFSINFYKWYIANRQADSNFPSTDQLTTSFSQWATSNFILYYQSAIQNVNDADPILYSQDDPLEWGSGMTATILTQTDTTSSVKVVIGSGSLAHTYTVKLVKSSAQWLVDSISGTY